jgi:hypothetical protein
VEKENVVSDVARIFPRMKVPRQHDRRETHDDNQLTTIGGKIVKSKKAMSERIVWKYKSQIPLATMTLFYHSSLETIQTLQSNTVVSAISVTSLCLPSSRKEEKSTF